MPSNPFKAPTQFALTKLDRELLDPASPLFGGNSITNFCKAYFDLDVFPWQHFFVHYAVKNKMVVAGIRVGKSKGAAMGILHFMHYHPHVRILNTSISSEQAKIVYHNMMELATMDRYKHWVERVEKSPYPLLRLVNGAECWYRSVGYEAELLRGFEFDLINIDEAAYIATEMTITTLRGRLLGYNQLRGEPRMGLMWYLTSPKGKTGWLFDRWKLGDERYGGDPKKYLSLRVRTVDNPMLDQTALKEIMADYTDRMILQELEGEFLDSETSEFEREQLLKLCDESDPVVAELARQLARYTEKHNAARSSFRAKLGLEADLDRFELEPQAGRRYLASWDLGKKPTKAGRNATVGMVFDITELPWRMVGYRYEAGMGYLPALTFIEELHHKYSSKGTECYTVVDTTGKGDVLNEIIETEQRFAIDGIVYNSVLKPNMIAAAKIAIERELVRYPFVRRFIDQAAQYTQIDADLPQDTVMAFAQAMYKARELTGLASFKPHRAQPSLYRASTPVGAELGQRRLQQRRRAAMQQRSGRVYA